MGSGWLVSWGPRAQGAVFLVCVCGGEGTVLLYSETLSTPLTLPSCLPEEGYQVSDSSVLISRVPGYRGLFWVEGHPRLFNC